MTSEIDIITYNVHGHITDHNTVVINPKDKTVLTIMPQETWYKIQEFLKANTPTTITNEDVTP